MGKTIEELLDIMIPDFDIIEHEEDDPTWFEKKLAELYKDTDNLIPDDEDVQ